MTRPEINQDAIVRAIDRIISKTEYRLQEKGRGVYAGPHETYGIIAEEFNELLDAMRENEGVAFHKELLDIAVACVIGMASYLSDDTSAEAHT